MASRQNANGLSTYVEAVEKVVAVGLGSLLEKLQVLEDLSFNVGSLVVSDTVLTEEVKGDLVGRLEGDVLVLQ